MMSSVGAITLGSEAPARSGCRTGTPLSARLSPLPEASKPSALLERARASSGLPARGRRRFVGDGPEQADLLHGCNEFLKSQRFDNVGVDAQLVAANDVGFFTRRGHDHG